MERKNTILLTVIAVATLLVAVVGATFAYFTATIQDDRTTENGNGTANITAGQVANTTVVANVEGAAGKFTATDLGASNVKVSLYKSSTLIATTENYFGCEHKVETVDNEQRYSETCTDKSVGTLVKETTLTGGAQKVVLGQDTITTTAADTDETVYYYVVVEFVNNGNQDTVMGKSLAGTVSVKPAA